MTVKTREITHRSLQSDTYRIEYIVGGEKATIYRNEGVMMHFLVEHTDELVNLLDELRQCIGRDLNA